MMIVGGKTNLWFGLDQVIGYYFLFKICGRLSIQVTNADKLNQDVEIRRIRENLILEAHTQVQSAIHPWWTNQPVVQWLARCNDGETIAFSGDVPLVCLTVCCALPVVTGMGRDDGGTIIMMAIIIENISRSVQLLSSSTSAADSPLGLAG